MNEQTAPVQWYAANTGNHQGLIIDEKTGANIAVTYNAEHAAFIVTACNSHAALVDALQNLMDRAVKDAEKYAPEGNEPIWAFISDASTAIHNTHQS